MLLALLTASMLQVPDSAGVGISILPQRDTVWVVGVAESGPAHAAGILPGDGLLAVAEQTLVARPPEEVVRLLSGPAGSVASLRVLRDAVPRTYDVTRGTDSGADILGFGCFSGDCSDGGWGLWITSDRRRYEGEFQAGVPHGRGSFYFPNGESMSGTFQGGAFVEGLRTLADGSQFTGTFGANAVPVEGRMVTADGRVFEGVLRSDGSFDRGVLTRPDGVRSEGEWTGGDFEGVIDFPEGVRYEGVLAGGEVFDGPGVLTIGEEAIPVRFEDGAWDPAPPLAFLVSLLGRSPDAGVLGWLLAQWTDRYPEEDHDPCWGSYGVCSYSRFGFDYGLATDGTMDYVQIGLSANPSPRDMGFLGDLPGGLDHRSSPADVEGVFGPRLERLPTANRPRWRHRAGDYTVVSKIAERLLNDPDDDTLLGLTVARAEEGRPPHEQWDGIDAVLAARQRVEIEARDRRDRERRAREGPAIRRSFFESTAPTRPRSERGSLEACVDAVMAAVDSGQWLFSDRYDGWVGGGIGWDTFFARSPDRGVFVVVVVGGEVGSLHTSISDPSGAIYSGAFEAPELRDRTGCGIGGGRDATARPDVPNTQWFIRVSASGPRSRAAILVYREKLGRE